MNKALIQGLQPTLNQLRVLGISRAELICTHQSNDTYPAISYEPSQTRPLPAQHDALKAFWYTLNEEGEYSARVYPLTGEVEVIEHLERHEYRNDTDRYSPEGQHLSHTEGRWET